MSRKRRKKDVRFTVGDMKKGDKIIIQHLPQLCSADSGLGTSLFTPLSYFPNFSLKNPSFLLAVSVSTIKTRKIKQFLALCEKISLLKTKKQFSNNHQDCISFSYQKTSNPNIKLLLQASSPFN